MKKFMIAAATVLASAFGAYAAGEYTHSVLVNLKEGDNVAYKFEETPVAQIDGDNLKITLGTTGQSVLYPFADVVNLTFNKEVSGVAGVNDDATATFGLSSETLEATGLTAGTEISVFDAGGALRVRGTANDNGYAAVYVGNLDKGVYLVKAGKHTFKFIR